MNSPCCDTKARIDALTREVAFFKDAAAAFCCDLMFVESERDALKAALDALKQIKEPA